LIVSPEIYQTPIERLDLSPRTLNCLKRAHLTKVGEILEMSDDELLKIRNFGEKSLTELRDKLSERGIAAIRTEASESDDQSQPVEAVEPSGALENLSSDDIGELLGGDTVVMAAPELIEADLDRPEEGDVEDDQEDDEGDDQGDDEEANH